MKRILCLALTLVMVLSMVPATVFATEAAPALPTAMVTEIQHEELTFAMNFVANSATEEQLAYYGNWYADFELTINKDVTLDANGTGDGYLSGQYDEWSENWVNVPFNKTVTLEANKTLKIMEFAAEMLDEPGLKYTYQEVFEVVKDFKCGVYFTPEFLMANPDLEVTLELRMYDPADESKSYGIGQTYTFQNNFVARNTATGKLYNTVAKAILAARAGETVALIRDAEEKITSVLTGVTLDLNGYTLTTDYVTCFGDIIDSSNGNAGLLKVDSARILIQKSNEQLPVKNGAGYRFVDVLKFNQKMKEETKFVFQPLFEEDAHALLLAGKEATGVSVMVRVSWTQTQGTRTQDFAYNDSFVQDFINSYNAKEAGKYGQQLTLTLNSASSIEDLTFTAVVSSDLGVQFTSADVQDDTTGGETGNVTVKDNMVAEEVTINSDQASAVVPEGTLLQENTTSLTLTVQEMDESNSNITLGENEEKKSVDVHIEGIAADNTVPMLITINEFAEIGLNEGNLKLYHVENGQTVEMTRVYSLAEVDAHNEFYYDIATGTVTVALATFSEIAAVENTVNDWNGGFDYSWYNTSDKELYIANADQLAAFGAIVGGMAADFQQDSFTGKTVKLLADINLGDAEEANDENKIFYPIGYNSSDGLYEKTGVAVTTGFYNFCGTFDGNGHTIANFYHNTWEMKGDNNYYDASLQYFRDGMGLFGRIYKGTVRNLTVRNFSADGEYTTTGVIAAYADGATFENIAVFGCNPRVYNIGNGGIVGCVGWYAKEAGLKTTFKNITVDNSNKISALWGSYDVACGGIVGQYYPISGQTSANKPTNGGLHFDNCHISAQMDVYNDVCGNYQYYAYRYAGMLIGSVRENVTIDGHVYPDMTGITAEGCTVHFGTWNDYYYCEFVKNGHPSYSGPTDYKFSRVPNSEIDTSNGKENATCIGHNHTEVEDNQAIYLPFNNLVTGYGWGVTTKVVGEMDGVEILDRKDGSSVVKFEKADTAKDSYTIGTTVTIGELFGATEAGLDEKTQIKSDSIQVAVSPVGETSTAGGTYTPNAEDWTKGTLTFTGNGTATITITDYYFCTPTTITVTVTEKVSVEKFESKFTGDFLYRVGNQNAVKLDSLFKAKEGAQIGTVQVTIETIHGATGAYTPNATWTNGTIQFSGTGIVKVTITDNDSCIPLELTLEVVDAKNTTTATNATESNIVLLNNIGSGFTVSGRYTFYGNGFTLNYTGNGQYLNNGLKQGIVTVSENGTLDNLRIVATVYPAAYLYYGSNSLGEAVQDGPYSTDGDKIRYHYQLSAVVAKGNATIANCYIYGARNNIFVDVGDVTITDTVLECGTVSNVQIVSNATHTVTFNNVTTIQHQVNPTMGDTSLVMMGAGILVGPETNDNPTIVLDGEFKQYNWVTSEDKAAVSIPMAKAIIQGALDATDYNHTINGKTASNLGIIYLNTFNSPVTNKTGLPYLNNEITIKPDGFGGNSVTGQAYSLISASSEQIYSDYVNADKTTNNGYYEPQFKYSADLGGQHVAEGGDEHCYRVGDTIHILFPSGDSKELNLAGLVSIDKYSQQDLNMEISCKDSSGNAVAVSNGKITLFAADEYTVTYTVTDTLFFDKNGNLVDGSDARAVTSQTKTYSWTVTLSVSLKDTAVPNAYFEFDSSKQIMGYGTKGILEGGLGKNNFQYLPFLAGMKIYDYNRQDSYLRFDGNTDFGKIAKIDLVCQNDKAYVTVTLTDGGVIHVEFSGRAASGSATKTGSIKVSGSTVYYLTDGDTSATTTTWTINSYSFVGNNGVEIKDTKQVFSNCVKGTVPTGSFGTTIKYTVTLDANEGNCGQTTAYATSAATAVTLPTPSRSGYVFAGWFTAASGGVRAGGAGDSYTPTANVTLYAQWGKPSTVTYNANGGSCDKESEKYTSDALILPTPTRDGYWFVNWTDANGKEIGKAGASYRPTGDIELYAQWSPVYTVIYNADGGNVTPASAEYKGTALILPMPTREGYAFDGWSDGNTTYKAGESYTPTANVTFTAQWKAPATVTYDATTNGGSCSTTSQTYLGNALTLPTPAVRTGYTFNGWYTAASGGTKIGDAGASYAPEANITLYAQWTHNTYTIKVGTQSNATVTIDKTSAHYGETVSVTVSFSKNNNKSLKWKNDTTGTETTLASSNGTYTFTMPAANVTVSASSSGTCVTPDTLITMADGTQKEIQNISVGEEILTWNFYTGAFEAVPAALVQADDEGVMNVLHMYFEDGTELKVLGEHGIFDADLNDFIFIDEFDVENYLGHSFVQKDGDGYKTVKLVGYEITTEDIVAYTILAAYHYNVVAEGMFTNTPAHVGDNFFNPFDICEGMKYNEEQVEAEIAEYGLYTYEDFAHVLTEEQFKLLNLGHFKVSVGKGRVTFDGLIFLIENFVNR